jgi:hypothetical protein
MKMLPIIPLLFLSACSTTPKLILHPQAPVSATDTVRYPEVIHAYHVGRYADPTDALVLHEQHAVYRVEENARWSLRSLRTATPGGAIDASPTISPPQDVAFSPTPVNDAILAEVNSQRLATAQIMAESRTLAAALAQLQDAWPQTRTNLQQMAALRATVAEMQQRLAALEPAPGPPGTHSISTTNATEDPLHP